MQKPPVCGIIALPDDIGSNLGGIILLTECGNGQDNVQHMRNDFQSLRIAAKRASEAMRDVVWLIQKNEVGLGDFVTRMRQPARAILRSTEVTLRVEPATMPNRKLSLLFRRHILLAFKETLNNVRKHAGV